MEFWQTLDLAQKIYFCVGLGASVFLVLQIITLLFGIGETGETEIDLSGDGEADAIVDLADGFHLFTLRGLVAFFATSKVYFFSPILSMESSVMIGRMIIS